MRGRPPSPRHLPPADRRYLGAIVRDGHVIQRVASRARALLALADGEALPVVRHWTGLGRTALWDLWGRYQARGVDAIYDADRSGRPPTFPPWRARGSSASRAPSRPPTGGASRGGTAGVWPRSWPSRPWSTRSTTLPSRASSAPPVSSRTAAGTGRPRPLTRRELHAWAAKKDLMICSQTSATVH
jgi:hypothetical protein